MMNESNSANRRQDLRLLQNICLKLSWVSILTRFIVVITIAIVWAWLCSLVLVKTATLRYDGFDALGTQIVDFLTRINPYFWKGLLLILTLFVLGGVRRYIIDSMNRGRATLVPLDSVSTLAKSLSPQALDVLRWVWKDKEVPLSYGNLQTARKQLASGRVKKLALARAQRAVLENALNEQEKDASNVKDAPKFRHKT
jgi:hypothetical protein